MDYVNDVVTDDLAITKRSATARPNDQFEVVMINGKPFATGLLWKSLSSPRGYMKEARAIGKQRKWDVVAIRRGLVTQAGFVPRKVGPLKGHYSLAAALAGQLGDTWVGAFKITEERYAVVAVREKSILPGFDCILDREDARTKLQEAANHISSLQDENLYAPADFGIAQRELDIHDLLKTKRLKSDYRLKQLQFGLTKKELISSVLLLGLLVGAYIGFEQYRTMEAQKERLRQIQLMQEREAALKKLNEKTKEQQGMQALAHPWASFPSAIDFTQACGDVIDSAPLSVGGWMVSKAVCDAKGVAFTYNRATGGTTVQGFVDGAQGLFLHTPAFSPDAMVATVHREWKAPYTGDEPLLEADLVLTEITTLLQSLDIAPQIASRKIDIPAPPPANPGEAVVPAPQPDWQEFTFSFTSDNEPVKWIESMQNRNGVRVKQIQVELNADDATLKWLVSGDIYAKI